MIVLDTTVLVYAVGDDHALREPARVIVEAVENGEDRKLRFDWTERGVTAMASEPRRRGFGTEILERSLGYELKADTTLAFAPDGIRCRIVLPLDLISASGTGRAASGARAW